MLDSLMPNSRCAALLPWASANLMAASFSFVVLAVLCFPILDVKRKNGPELQQGDNIKVWLFLSYVKDNDKIGVFHYKR